MPREVFQSFSQDPQNEGHLMNYNNTLAEMHYSDDWYVLNASWNPSSSHTEVSTTMSSHS